MKEFEREEKQAIIDTNRRLRGESKPKQNPTDRIKTLGRVIEKAKIGKPVNYKPVVGEESTAIEDLENRLGEKTKRNIKKKC